MNFRINDYFDLEYSVTIKIKKGEDNDPLVVVLNTDCSVCINEEDGWYFVMIYDKTGFTYQLFKTRDEKIAKKARYLISDAVAAIKLREAIKIIQENNFVNMTTKEAIEKIIDELKNLPECKDTFDFYLPEGQDTFDICNDYEDNSACYGEEFYD